MSLEKAYKRDVINYDCEKECKRISEIIRSSLRGKLRRRGIVVGVSGGIDSSVTAALSVRGAGAGRVLALFMPEKDSDPDSLILGEKLTDSLGIDSVCVDISGQLEAAGFSEKYTEAVRTVFPEYNSGWKSKIVLPDIVDTKKYSLFSVVVQNEKGELMKKRLTLKGYLGIVAATNFKQRIRKMTEYYYADLNNYAVAGTPNRLEYDQGFFVKLGDGAADIKPIAHLYKTQVFRMAEYLGLPEEIIQRRPTTDTYSLEQTQDEFYFSVEYKLMDIALYALNNNYSAEETAEVSGLETEQVERIFEDIKKKRRTTEYLHLKPLLAGEVEEIQF